MWANSFCNRPRKRESTFTLVADIALSLKWVVCSALTSFASLSPSMVSAFTQNVVPQWSPFYINKYRATVNCMFPSPPSFSDRSILYKPCRNFHPHNVKINHASFLSTFKCVNCLLREFIRCCCICLQLIRCMQLSEYKIFLNDCNTKFGFFRFLLRSCWSFFAVEC